jgi:hypothetical protein
MEIGHSGLNSVRENVLQSKHLPFAFELATNIVRDTSNADAADHRQRSVSQRLERERFVWRKEEAGPHAGAVIDVA